MVIGWSELAQGVEKDEEVNGVGMTLLVDERLNKTNQNSNQIEVVVVVKVKVGKCWVGKG